MTENKDLPTWDDMPKANEERKPPVKWEQGDSHDVTFTCQKPQQFTGKDGGKFFVFDVLHQGKDDEKLTPKAIVTSAWTMLTGIRQLGDDLNNKRVRITRTSKDGKSFYEVIDLDAVAEETVQE